MPDNFLSLTIYAAPGTVYPLTDPCPQQYNKYEYAEYEKELFHKSRSPREILFKILDVIFHEKFFKAKYFYGIAILL